MKTEIENLVRYMSANPAQNMTIYCNEVLGADGATVATFQTHAMAFKAVQTVRAEIDRIILKGVA